MKYLICSSKKVNNNRLLNTKFILYRNRSKPMRRIENALSCARNISYPTRSIPYRIKTGPYTTCEDHIVL